MNNFNTPSEVVALNIASGKAKASLPLPKMLILAILAGIFIAIGGEASSLASHDIANVGLARMVTGAVFPVGLMMIVLVGGELFTGNTMIIMAVLDRQTTLLRYIRNLVFVWLGNLLGSLFIALITFLTGQWSYSGGKLGAYTLKIALGKCNMSFASAFTSGILCNILVCVAVLMAISAKDTAGKILGIFFPIFAFVTSGFEHSVANMYYIPAGMLAASNPDFAAKAKELYGITDAALSSLSVSGMLGNLLPVTLGNIVGGAFVLALPLYLINKKHAA